MTLILLSSTLLLNDKSCLSQLHRQVGPQGVETVVPVPGDKTQPGRLYPLLCWGTSEYLSPSQ